MQMFLAVSRDVLSSVAAEKAFNPSAQHTSVDEMLSKSQLLFTLQRGAKHLVLCTGHSVVAWRLCYGIEKTGLA
jgi:hypothetical protein